MWPRQQSARRREEASVGPRHRRTPDLSLKDPEFVTQQDDFQVLDLVRLTLQGREAASIHRSAT